DPQKGSSLSVGVQTDGTVVKTVGSPPARLYGGRSDPPRARPSSRAWRTGRRRRLAFFLAHRAKGLRELAPDVRQQRLTRGSANLTVDRFRWAGPRPPRDRRARPQSPGSRALGPGGGSLDLA